MSDSSRAASLVGNLFTSGSGAGAAVSRASAAPGGVQRPSVAEGRVQGEDKRDTREPPFNELLMRLAVQAESAKSSQDDTEHDGVTILDLLGAVSEIDDTQLATFLSQRSSHGDVAFPLADVLLAQMLVGAENDSTPGEDDLQQLLADGHAAAVLQALVARALESLAASTDAAGSDSESVANIEAQLQQLQALLTTAADDLVAKPAQLQPSLVIDSGLQASDLEQALKAIRSAAPALREALQAALAEVRGMDPTWPANDDLQRQPAIAARAVLEALMPPGEQTTDEPPSMVLQKLADAARPSSSTEGSVSGSARAATDTPLRPLERGWDEAFASRVRWQVEQGLERAELRLEPQSLGRVSVRIDVDGDRLTLAIHAQTAQAREAIESALPRLRESMAQQGLTLLGADVSGGERRDGSDGTGETDASGDGSGPDGRGTAGLQEGEEGDLRQRGELRHAVPDRLFDGYA